VLPRWNLKGDREPEITGTSRRSERQFDPGFPNGIVDSGEPREPSSRTVTREGLYRRLWSSPATHVAAELGITSTALAKIARKLDVPVPPPGFWARVHAGQAKPKPPPLPPIAQGAPSRHRITGKRKRDPDPIEPPRALGPVPEPTPPPAPVDVEALVADADARLAILERATKLRSLADAMEPRIHTLPADAPQRVWLRSVRTEIARAEEDVLRGLGEGPARAAPARGSNPS
jgi:hypothetical protein